MCAEHRGNMEKQVGERGQFVGKENSREVL